MSGSVVLARLALPALDFPLYGRADKVQTVLAFLQNSVHPRLGPFGQRQVDVLMPELAASHAAFASVYMNFCQIVTYFAYMVLTQYHVHDKTSIRYTIGGSHADQHRL